MVHLAGKSYSGWPVRVLIRELQPQGENATWTASQQRPLLGSTVTSPCSRRTLLAHEHTPTHLPMDSRLVQQCLHSIERCCRPSRAQRSHPAPPTVPRDKCNNQRYSRDIASNMTFLLILYHSVGAGEAFQEGKHELPSATSHKARQRSHW